MPTTPNLGRWFDRLIRHDMRGPAVATAGIWLGIVVLVTGAIPALGRAGLVLSWVGCAQIGSSCVLFVAFAVLEFRDRMRRRS
jgi:hypothetical protein